MNPKFYLRSRKLCFPLVMFFSLNMTAIAEDELRVCAEPDNLPFSNQKQEGFENKIATLLAGELNLKPRYLWEKQRQGYIKNTLEANRCDVIVGVPYGHARLLTTKPYYRSGYVFVTQKERNLVIESFDDPILRTLKIGLHAIGNDGSNSPPAHALAHRGIVNNIVGYSMWGDSSVENPQAQVIEAVAKGEIDIAIVWGPIGGYFATKYGEQLAVVLALADVQMPKQPFSFDIAIGVRKDDSGLAAKLQQALEEKRNEIEEILTTYHIPLIKSSPDLVSSEANGETN